MRRLNEMLCQAIVWILIHTIYRLKKVNTEYIPETGPALLICNHVSFVDALIIAAASPRPIRFVMDHSIFKIPVANWFFRTNRCIPIASAKVDKRMMDAAFDEVSRALTAGDLVAIFPEGRITDTGELYPFRPGVQRILSKNQVPVIPMALSGLWGSFFSRRFGPAMTNWKRFVVPSKSFMKRLVPFRRVTLTVDAPVDARDAVPEYLQNLVLALRGDRK